MNGTVKCFNKTSGSGYITPADGTPDVLVHRIAIVGARHLDADEAVEFDAINCGRDRRAWRVRPIARRVAPSEYLRGTR